MKEFLSKKAVKHLTIELHPKILHEIGSTAADVNPILENNGYKMDKFHKECGAGYHLTAYS